jgi:predicted Rossmann fold flavoprotein
MTSDVIVLGAGAAGLMCAIEAGKRGRSVLVLERNDAFGKKIRISGGGRCNFTNLHTTAENFICGNPNFQKSALARYQPADVIDLVQRHGIRYHEKKLGQLFCDGSSEQILAMLRIECERAKVKIQLNCRVTMIEHKAGCFQLETNAGAFTCVSLVIATGGLSIPRLGATGFGHAVALQFGLRVTEVRPGLVPLLLENDEGRRLRSLRGVSVDAEVRSGSTAFRENVLFTHRGLSGPAILQISSYWKPGQEIAIDTLPDEDSEIRLARRFVQTWNELYEPKKPRAHWTRKEIDAYETRQHDWKLTPSGTEGYAKAEVTVGGVDTAELSSQTMEAKRVPGLYFIGEVVDVTGQLGGFNFQWAWASGFAAGQAV